MRVENTMNFYQLFNDTLETFLKDLASTFDYIPELKKIKSAVTLARNLNQKTPSTIFKKYVEGMYRQQILSKDEAFFLQQQQYGFDTNNWVTFVQLIKGIWRDLDEENKEVIWKYMHTLIALSDKCCKSK